MSCAGTPAELARLPPPLQVRRALEELGPTFVKLGQILAGRADLFGPEWIAEFEKLHSRVPAVPFQDLQAQLVEDLGGRPAEVFAWFDEKPLAAASISRRGDVVRKIVGQTKRARKAAEELWEEVVQSLETGHCAHLVLPCRFDAAKRVAPKGYP